VRHHLLDLVDPWEEFDGRPFQAAGPCRGLADIEARGAPVLVGGTGLYLRAVVDDLEMPGQYPEVRAELDAEPDTEALHRRLAELDPAPPAAWSPPTAAGWCGRSR
jgi:tRNA dimethylallyltransferase